MFEIFHDLSLLSLVGWGLVITGTVFIVSAVIGIVRFPDFYSRMHAAGVADSFGLFLCIIGFACLQPEIESAIKLLVLACFTLVIFPVSAHSLVKAAKAQNVPYDKNEKL